MVKLNDAQWILIRRAYERTSDTVASIAERHGISRQTITNRSLKEGWGERGRIHQRAAPDASDDPGIEGLIKRFYGLIRMKLEHLEEDMARSNERTPADNDRETRAIGSLIRNTEKVYGLEQERGNDARARGNKPENAAEAEAIRRELAERLVRLREAERGDGT